MRQSSFFSYRQILRPRLLQQDKYSHVQMQNPFEAEYMHQIPSTAKRRKGEMSFPTKPASIMQPSTKPLQYAHSNKLSLFKNTHTQKLLALVRRLLKQEGVGNHLLWPLWEPTGNVSAPVPKTQALGLASLSDRSNCWICLLRKQRLSAKNWLGTLHLRYGHSVHWVTPHLRQLNLSIIKQSPTDSLSILFGVVSAHTHTKSTDKQAAPQKL